MDIVQAIKTQFDFNRSILDDVDWSLYFNNTESQEFKDALSYFKKIGLSAIDFIWRSGFYDDVKPNVAELRKYMRTRR